MLTLEGGSIWRGRRAKRVYWFHKGNLQVAWLFYLRFLQAYLKCACYLLFHLNATPGLLEGLPSDKRINYILVKTVHIHRRSLNLVERGAFSARKEISKHQPRYLQSTLLTTSPWASGHCLESVSPFQVAPAACPAAARALRAAARWQPGGCLPHKAQSPHRK